MISKSYLTDTLSNDYRYDIESIKSNGLVVLVRIIYLQHD